MYSYIWEFLHHIQVTKAITYNFKLIAAATFTRIYILSVYILVANNIYNIKWYKVIKGDMI